MGIIVSKAGEKTRKVETKPFAKESDLQQYIYDNPEAIPLDEIREDIRLLVLAREFPTESGPIDALGIDESGEIYVIETKLYKNPDKRKVVAQMLDYGASMWRTYSDGGELRAKLEEAVAKQCDKSLLEHVREFFELDDKEQATELLQNVESNVQSGRLRFVVLMDTMDDRLKDLILFVNENSRFDIYGVETDFYEFDGYQILIPTLYGAQTRKPTPTGKQVWTEEKFVAALEDHDVPGPRAQRIRALIALTEANADLFSTRCGTGGKAVMIVDNPDGGGPIFRMWTNGRFYLVGPFRRGLQPATVHALMSKYATALKWSRQFNDDMHGSPRLKDNLEDISEESFIKLKELLIEFATMRSTDG